MAKRQKIKNEDPSINFRLPEELKAEIYKEASRLNKTVSIFLRDHLTEFMDGSLYAREIAYYKDNSYVNSTEFLQLITWMYSKRNNNTCIASNEQLNKYIKTIKRMDFSIPINLEREFDKVLVDLVRVRDDKGSLYRSFYFCNSSLYDANFNYEVLENFLLNVLKPSPVISSSKN
jgi:hypothetical protein